LVSAFTLYLENQALTGKMAAIESQINTAALKQESIEQLQARVQKLKINHERKKEMITVLGGKITKLKKISVEKHIYSQALLVIARHLPENIKCNSIEMENDAGSISGSAVDYGVLPELTEKLGNEIEVFANVELETLSRTQDMDNTFAPYNFHIQFRLK